MESTSRTPGEVSEPRRCRRPDQAIYVPRALRGKDMDKQVKEHWENTSTCSSTSVSVSGESCPDTTEGSVTSTNQHTTLNPAHQSGSLELFAPHFTSDPYRWRAGYDQTLSYFVRLNLDDEEVDDDEHENRESVQSSRSNSTSVPPSIVSTQKETERDDFTEEIIAKLTETDITIEHAQQDYSAFENVWINEAEFTHVIEIYNFPAMFKTDDLLDAFRDYSGGGMKIKWVDNTHALAVFSCQAAALDALSLKHPLLRTRPLTQASMKSKGKAARLAEFILPVKERPRTDTAVARRMVTHALGLPQGRGRGKRF